MIPATALFRFRTSFEGSSLVPFRRKSVGLMVKDLSLVGRLEWLLGKEVIAFRLAGALSALEIDRGFHPAVRRGSRIDYETVLMASSRIEQISLEMVRSGYIGGPVVEDTTKDTG